MTDDDRRDAVDVDARREDLEVSKDDWGCGKATLPEHAVGEAYLDLPDLSDDTRLSVKGYGHDEGDDPQVEVSLASDSFWLNVPLSPAEARAVARDLEVVAAKAEELADELGAATGSERILFQDGQADIGERH